MADLAEFQFEILPSMDATDGVVFGIGAEVSMDDGGFHPGSTSWATQDAPSTANGTTQFGRDKLLGPVWAFDLHVDRSETAEAVDSLARHTTAWRALHIRSVPGAVIPLRYRIADRVRRVMGRPGNHEASPSNLIMYGYTPITCDFTCKDGYTYDDEVSSAILTLGTNDDGNSGGGLVFPTTLPTNSLPGTEAVAALVVGGDAPAKPLLRLNGPWTDPVVYTEDWRLSLPGYEIPAGQFVEIDTAPWANTVMLNGTASIGGRLGRHQKLDDVRLMPGALDIRIAGFSSTGAATCQIIWRNTHNSI